MRLANNGMHRIGHKVGLPVMPDVRQRRENLTIEHFSWGERNVQRAYARKI